MNNDFSNNKAESKETLTERLAALSPAKRALLEQRLKKKNVNTVVKKTIPRRNNQDAVSLSFAQQRLWFLDQLEEERDTHHMSISLRLTGTLNVAALEQCFTEMVRRHESLRTTFQLSNGEAVQVIGSPFLVKLPVVFLQNKSEVEQSAEIQRLATQAHQQPFELAQGPLLRFTLLQLGEQSHILLLTMHHIISDGWSIKIFLRELSTLHTAFSIGEPSPLPKLPIQYADFAYWQRQWLTGEVLETLLNYWKQQLKEAPPLLELPTDRPRPSIQTYRGAKQVSELSPSLSQGLKTLSRQASVTLFITLLSAFKLLLSRYTGQTNIVVGTPIAGRNRTELENLMGFFINTQVLYTDLSGNPSFHELLSRVREVALGAYAHQELPFEKLVEELQPERNLSYTPLFQVWFNMINLADSQNEKQNEQSGLTIERFSLSEEIPSQFDLTLYVQEKDQAIQLTFVYNVDLFDATTITRLIGHFQTLLENIVTDPDKRLSSLRLLTERHHLSTRGNLVHPTIPFIEFEKREQSIPARFEEQVIKYSDQIAIKTMRYTWTYRDLNEKANQVAQAILKQEERVALLFEHDAPMLIGIMGVLKAGKTYVPLNPYSPRERLEYIVQDSQASAILTNDQNQSLAQALTSNTLRLINIDEIKLVASRDEIQPTLSADSIAYLLYTSGTSGKPKAVIQNHRNVLHFIRTYTNHLHITANDKLTLLSSYSFDAAIMDIFGALLNGATLYPVNLKEESLSHLSSWLIQQEVTLYHSTPTVYRHWLNTVTEERFPKIRLVVLGGEPVYKDDVDKYKKHFSTNCIFINGLGPTESTVSLQYFINHQTEITHQAVPVGYPVAETEILLLNETGEETDIYGEIAIKSPYIALGYWQKPELTQTVFLTDGDNQRLYRTGDMGRLRADGSIEFVGRKDFQVKLRGFRIELREVEAVLSQHPAVQETVVMLREETAGEKRLVAYWVPNQVPVTDTIELRRFIQEKLPDYMIPSAFVKLEAMPLANGKIDRRALPAPEQTQDNQESFVAPQDKLEQQLANLWEKVLHVHPIGRHDNFFERGGHSLLAVTLLAQIEKAFAQGLSMMTIFQAPTIAQFADILRDQGYKATWRALQAIQPQGSRPPLFFIGSTDYAHAIAPSQGTEQPVYGLNLFGLQPADGTTPSLTVEWIARQYIQEIQTVQPEGPYYLCGYCGDAKVAFEMALQLQAQKQSVALLAFIDVVWRTSSTQLQNRYVRFWHNLLEFGPSYFFYKIREKIKFYQGRLFLRLSKLEKEKKRYEQTGEALPLQLQHRLLIKSFFQALTHYVPQPYSGGITLFLSYEWRSKDSSALANIVTGGVEVHEIAGYHRNLFKEPQVSALGEQIKCCLEKTQNAN